jgi:nitrite reductase (NADH) small subunit
VIEQSLNPATELTRTVSMPAEHRLCPGAGASLLLDGFRLVGVAADVPLRGGRRATVRGRQISIFSLGDRFAAIERPCPHDHVDPFDGRVVDGHLTCPTHGWSVDSWTGSDAHGGPPVRVHTAVARDGLLYVRLAED